MALLWRSAGRPRTLEVLPLSSIAAFSINEANDASTAHADGTAASRPGSVQRRTFLPEAGEIVHLGTLLPFLFVGSRWFA